VAKGGESLLQSERKSGEGGEGVYSHSKTKKRILLNDRKDLKSMRGVNEEEKG